MNEMGPVPYFGAVRTSEQRQPAFGFTGFRSSGLLLC